MDKSQGKRESVFDGILPGRPAHSSPVPQSSDRSRPADTVISRLDAIDARMRKAEERHDAVISALSCAKVEAASFHSRLSGLENLSGELGGKVSALSRAIERCVTHAEPRLEQEERLASAQAMNALSLNMGVLDGRVKNLESGLQEELKRRFSAVDALAGDAARKAGLASEIGASVARRADKLDAAVSRLSSLEQRISGTEASLRSLYELEALAQSLRLSVSGMEKNFDAARSVCSQTAAENKKIGADFEALSRQVLQLSALFNQLRTELAFLLSGRNGAGIGG